MPSERTLDKRLKNLQVLTGELGLTRFSSFVNGWSVDSSGVLLERFICLVNGELHFYCTGPKQYYENLGMIIADCDEPATITVYDLDEGEEYVIRTEASVRSLDN